MRKRIKLILALCLLLVAGIGTYFYAPKIIGDSVYPLAYQAIIVKYATQYNVDPALVAAVILQESRFNPNAVSPKGATGLMQIMPATGAGIAKNLGVSNYSLKNPETSIMFGTFYLKNKLDNYGGDLDATLAAYNAGSGNADRWIRLGILDDIPFKETRNYVVRVKNYRTVYETMYSAELGITQNIELREVTKEEDASKIRGLIWSKIFENAFTWKW